MSSPANILKTNSGGNISSGDNSKVVESDTGSGFQKCSPRWLTLVVNVVFVVFLLGLYMIPTVFFIIPLRNLNTFDLQQTLTRFNPTGRDCHSPYPLINNSVCSNELSSLSSYCSLSGTLNELFIPISSQDEVQQFLIPIFRLGLPLVPLSTQCDVLLKHFFCFYIHGLCNGTRTLELSRESCQIITTGMCAHEWNELALSSDAFVIEDCEGLPSYNNSQQQCEVEYVLDISTICNDSRCVTEEVLSSGMELNCSEFFYFSKRTGNCRPTCRWSVVGNSLAEVIVSHLFIATSILFSLLYCILAFTIQRDWLQFPVVYYVFMNIDIFIIAVLRIIQQDTTLFCSNQDFYLSVQNDSPIPCFITGISLQYCLIQISYWLLFYAVTVWRSLSFPFNYKKLKDSGILNYFVGITIIVSLTFPLLVLVLVADGFYLTNVVFNSCSARNPKHFYFVSTLHLSLTMFACSVFLTLSVRSLVLEYFKKKRTYKGISLKIYKDAARKLLLVSSFFIAVIICVLSSQTATSTFTPQHYLSIFLDYLVCESYGVDSGRDCSQFLDIADVVSIYNLSLAALFFQSIIPLITFIMNSDFTKYANGVKKLFSTLSSK